MSSVLFDIPGPRAARRHRVIAGATVLGLLVLAALVAWKLWTEEQFTADKWEPFVTPKIIELMLSGLWDTVRAAILAVLLAIGVGLLFGAGKLSDHVFVRAPAWIFVEFFRAVPLLMVIIALFGIYGRDLTPFWCLVIGLTLYNGAVLAEVFRAGVNAVPRGQAEAAYAIGMRKTQVMTIVLLPQAIKIMIPAIISQCVVVLKDTSLGFYILAPGLTTAGRDVWNTFNNKFATALVLAATYIILNSILSWLATKAQRRLTGDHARVAVLAGQMDQSVTGGGGAGHGGNG
jgi:glutamate transport system permease protein